MSLRVLLVDDEPLARARLRRLLSSCQDPSATVAGEAANAVQAMELVRCQPFDLALLDIHMPGADGLKLARVWRELAQPPPVVFVTAHAEHAVQAFEVEALDYLTKPVRLERLQAALRKVVRVVPAAADAAARSAEDWLLATTPGHMRRIALSDVLYLKAEDKYVTAVTAAGSHLLDASLSQLEERYPGRFLRIHRNALVAPAAVRALVRAGGEGGAWSVQLAGVEEPLAVSRRQLPAVRAALDQ